MRVLFLILAVSTSADGRPFPGHQLVSMFREEDLVNPLSGLLKYNAGPQMELWVLK